MKLQERILSVKSDAKRLLTLIEALELVHPSDHMTIWTVLLQNLAFDSSNTVGYDTDKEWEDMNTIFKAFKAFEEYNKYHTISFIVSEIDMMFMASIQLEDEIGNINATGNSVAE